MLGLLRRQLQPREAEQPGGLQQGLPGQVLVADPQQAPREPFADDVPQPELRRHLAAEGGGNVAYRPCRDQAQPVSGVKRGARVPHQVDDLDLRVVLHQGQGPLHGVTDGFHDDGLGPGAGLLQQRQTAQNSGEAGVGPQTVEEEIGSIGHPHDPVGDGADVDVVEGAVEVGRQNVILHLQSAGGLAARRPMSWSQHRVYTGS